MRIELGVWGLLKTTEKLLFSLTTIPKNTKISDMFYKHNNSKIMILIIIYIKVKKMLHPDACKICIIGRQMQNHLFKQMLPLELYVKIFATAFRSLAQISWWPVPAFFKYHWYFLTSQWGLTPPAVTNFIKPTFLYLTTQIFSAIKKGILK